MKILCSPQTFVTVASFVQWRLQHGTYFPDKTQSTEYLRWYLIVSIYKLQYIWICCQFLLQLLILIFNVITNWNDLTSVPMGIETILFLKVGNKLAGLLPIALALICWNWFLISSKTWLISPPSLWGLIRTCRWKAGMGWAQSIAWANKRCMFLWLSLFRSEKSFLESNTLLWKFCWPDSTNKGLLLEKSWNFYVSVSFFKFTHGIILVIRRWGEVSRHAGQWLTLVKLWNSCGQWTRGRITRKRMHRYETITVIN